ncbi:hypothetical protein VNI00_008293 [Paramarasmius palmivorus]|uniref:NYN domain-containing protein n=1 Tax=Paramarasmius palmivorus TaxID=297713 RepID=A0AAW0CX14_9AGAR
MSSAEQVAIFWDYENCQVPFSASGFSVVNQIRGVVHQFGGIKLFRAYADLSELSSPRLLSVRSELQCSGVSLIDCPHNGRKNVVDQMIIVDMLAYAIDHSTLDTILLISGDRDFAYAIATLRSRMYKVIVMAPSAPSPHVSLRAQASVFIDWNSAVLDALPEERLNPEGSPRANGASSTRSPPQTTKPLSNNSVFDLRGSSLFGEGSSRNTPSQLLSEPSMLVDGERTITPSSAPGLPTYTASVEPIPSETLNVSVTLESNPRVHPDKAIPDPHLIGLRPPALLSPTAAPFTQQGTYPSIPARDPVAVLPGSVPRQGASVQPAVFTPSTELHISPQFQGLVRVLRELCQKGNPRPLRSLVSLELINSDRTTYQKAGVARFREFVDLAVSAEVIEAGGIGGGAWVKLHSNLSSKI